MPLTFINRSKPGHPLLPAASLEGLEKFVPPGQPWPLEHKLSWRFKPLPALPRRDSSVYSRSITDSKHFSRCEIYNYIDLPPTPYHHDSVSLGDRGSREMPHGRRRLPISSLREEIRPPSDTLGRSIPHQNSSPALSRDTGWADGASYPDIDHLWTSETDEPAAEIRTATFRRVGSSSHISGTFPAPSVMTIESIDPALMPRPLEVESSQSGDDDEPSETKVPSPVLVVEYSDPDICFCHSPHPRHDRAFPMPRISNNPKVRLGSQKGWKSMETLPTQLRLEEIEITRRTTAVGVMERRSEMGVVEEDSCGESGAGISEVQLGDIEKPKIELIEKVAPQGKENKKPQMPTDNEDSRSTKLTPFSTRQSDEVIGEEKTIETPVTLNIERPHPSPAISRSASLPSPSLFPRHSRRQKQPAIPPTEYQKYGPQAWTKEETRPRSQSREKRKSKSGRKSKSRIARYLRRLFRKEPRTHAHKTSEPEEQTPVQAQPEFPPVPRLAPAPPPYSRPSLRQRPATPAFHRTFTAPTGGPVVPKEMEDLHRSYSSVSRSSEKPIGMVPSPVDPGYWRASATSYRSKLGPAGGKPNISGNGAQIMPTAQQGSPRSVAMTARPKPAVDENGNHWL